MANSLENHFVVGLNKKNAIATRKRINHITAK